ncbi:unnamed protein product [Rhizophagus irregularis]|nr:unnamed protein product [Rhizophagus irregularis]
MNLVQPYMRLIANYVTLIFVCNKNISFGHFTINIRRENLSKKPSSCTYNVSAELSAMKMKYNVKFMGVIVKIST